MSELYLVHHGILGQKWGKKNGPPYPLNFDDLSAEERKLAKDESIRKGDIKTAGANKKHYTDNELNEVMNRFNINQKLDSLNASQIQTGLDKAKKLCDTMGTIGEYGEKAVKGYNTVTKITNSLMGTNFPRITDGNPNSKKNDNNNNQEKNNNSQNGGSGQKKNDQSGKTVNYNYNNGVLTNKNVRIVRGNKTVNKNYKINTKKKK